MKPSRSMFRLSVFDLQRYAVDALRQRVAGDRQRGRARVDLDPRADHDRAEVERARHRRHHDRQADTARPRTGPSGTALPSSDQRVARPVPPPTVAVPILLCAPHAPARACASAQSGTLESMPSRPGGRRTLSASQVLVLVAARQRHRQRAERAGLVVGRARHERRAGTAATRSRSASNGSLDGSRRRFAAVRRQLRARRQRRAARRGVGQRGARAAVERQLALLRTGSCGSSAKLAVSWPVAWSIDT